MNRHKPLYLIVLLSIYLFLNTSIYPTMECYGLVCSSIPNKYFSYLNELDLVFRDKYIRQIMQSMAESGMIANAGQGNVGKGFINRFEVSTFGTGSYIKKDTISVNYREYTFNDLPNVGVALNPGAMFGVNLGWLLGNGKSFSKKRSFWHRFNLYIFGTNLRYSISDMKAVNFQGDKVKGGIFNSGRGGAIRFQLFKDYSFLRSILTFNGLNLGVSYGTQDLTIHLETREDKNPPIILDNYIGTWSSNSTLNYRTKTSYLSADFRTGFRILYFLTFYAGYGYTKTHGGSVLDIERGGPLKISQNLEKGLANQYAKDTNQYYNNNSLSNTSNLNPEGLFSFKDKEYHRIKINRNYVVAGLEFNVFGLILMIEGIYSETARAATLGLKLSL